MAWLAIILGLSGTAIRAQTFVQLTDLGSNIGPRLTRAVARQRIDRSLFGSIGTKVSFVSIGTVYQFAGDPEWSRILVGLKDQWIHQYDNAAGPGGRLLQPLGIDISARKYFYSADRAKGMVFLAEFSPAAKNLINPGIWTSPQFPRPIDVAWDGRTTPLTADFLYVLDDSLSLVSYWDRPTLLWSYGTPGSGVGQFLNPSGICAGKTVGSNGGTQFTTYFYVVDRGNRRVVWLNRGANGPSWLGVEALPNWDPTDCAVDHFGNLYVVDQLNHRLHKFTYSLTSLAMYGTYGKGPSSYNTFAWPHAVSVPCGLKVVNNQTVWYCEGRVITAEQWSDSSGAVEHYLGLELSHTGGPDTSGFLTTLSYFVTDHSYHTVVVKEASTGNTVRRLYIETLMPSGTTTALWDGHRTDGTPAPPGYYYFFVDAYSAYGCNSQGWCSQSFNSPSFWFKAGCGDPDPTAAPAASRAIARSASAPPDPCDPGLSADGPAGTLSDAPTKTFLRQRVSPTARPLARVAPAAASAPSAAEATSTGSLTELVRQYGVRGLSFGVPRGATGEAATIRVYSLAGRPIRFLVNEHLDPGYYEVAWDGLDDRGRPAAPGVYIAVLSVGGQRVVQRLILRQTP